MEMAEAGRSERPHLAKLDGFPGGLSLAGWKYLSNSGPVGAVPIPPRLRIPLRQHVGTASVPVVSPGEHVLKGQPIARPDSYVSMMLHAPTSGTVGGIDDLQIAHPSGLTAPCLSLHPDGHDEWCRKWPALDWSHADHEQVLSRIADAGIIGLGGAGFPTHVKVREGIGHSVDTLIINGVECEPYITCDDRLMRERAHEVCAGARILAHVVKASRCVIAVEDSMPDACAALLEAERTSIEVIQVPTLYPAGGEKQLIKVLTGMEVPSGGLAIHIGVLMHNVATAAAIYRAVCLGEPMVSRIVTVTGRVARPGNFDVLLGTSVSHLLECAGGIDASDAHSLIMGGPMMGVRLGSASVPLSKTSNCVLVLEAWRGEQRISPCIRCGRCADVCPVALQPQSLYELSKAADFDGVQDFHIFDCIECGCCAYVCPSRIPLVQYYRFAKSEIEALDEAHERAAAARLRYEEHLRRQADPALTSNFQDRAAGPGEKADEDAPARRAYVARAVERARKKHRW